MSDSFTSNGLPADGGAPMEVAKGALTHFPLQVKRERVEPAAFYLAMLREMPRVIVEPSFLQWAQTENSAVSIAAIKLASMLWAVRAPKTVPMADVVTADRDVGAEVLLWQIASVVDDIRSRTMNRLATVGDAADYIHVRDGIVVMKCPAQGTADFDVRLTFIRLSFITERRLPLAIAKDSRYILASF